MAANPRPIRQSEAPPPGKVTAFCASCKSEVLVSEHDRLCPDCGRAVHPLSLPSVMHRVDEPEPLGTTTPRSATVVLPRLPELVSWYSFTERRRNDLADREADLAARRAELTAELKEVMQGRKMLDQVLGAVRLEPEEDDGA